MSLDKTILLFYFTFQENNIYLGICKVQHEINFEKHQFHMIPDNPLTK